MTQAHNALLNLITLAFVVTSMLTMGLSLTIPQVLAPLRNGRLLALLANFMFTCLIPVQEVLRIGIILLGTAAGAPFLP
jgi:predicted Na+-dependent transporter